MKDSARKAFGPFSIVFPAIAVLGALGGLMGQVPENPSDPSGVNIPYPFLHLVHSRDISLRGSTAYLRAFDPFLFYQLGRDLVNRQFTLSEGLYGRSGELSVPLYATGGPSVSRNGARFARDHAASCGSCHSIPAREPGGGQTISSTGGMGRNTPHFFGAGLVEMIGEQIRTEILTRCDGDGNGRIEPSEASACDRLLIEPTPGSEPVDFGELAADSHGVPQLNNLFRVWYLDANGRVVPGARSLKTPGVVSFNFVPQPFGWGRGLRSEPAGEKISQGAEAETLRGIYTLAADVHMGLQADDPGQRIRRSAAGGSGGIASASLNGAQQYDFGHAPDLGRRRGPTGISLDDPDRDGVLGEILEGDVDAAEFYMLHAPPPALRRTPSSERGRQVMKEIGCTRCHVENWLIRGRGPGGRKGDRRLFHLDTQSHKDRQGLVQVTLRLVPLYRRDSLGRFEPLGGPFLVERVYSDFKHWDIGDEFYERRYDGTLQTRHRTAPLWGVGTTPPYGHSGRFQSLEDVIEAHGGAASGAAAAYRRLKPGRRSLLIEYLQSLVLYFTDQIRADINRDGVLEDDFRVGGQRVGYERFDARFLFQRVPRYRLLYWITGADGLEFPLALIDNVSEIYRLELPYRRDSDGDGYPDVIDPEPQLRP